MLTREVKLIQPTNPGESRRLLEELPEIRASLYQRFLGGGKVVLGNN